MPNFPTDPQRRQVLGWSRAVAVPITSVASTSPFAKTPVRFALLGDTPYNAPEAHVFTQVLDQIDAACEFTLHIGDIKARREPWRTDFFEQRLALFQQAHQPLVLLPGDNEWSDVPQGSAKSAFAWLHWLREHAYKRWPGATFEAAQLLFERQGRQADGDVPIENMRWILPRLPEVLFITLNIPGGVDLRRYSLREQESFRTLQEFNERWLDESMHLCARRGVSHIVLAAHADLLFEKDRTGPGTSPLMAQDYYSATRRWLARSAKGFAGQILFLHGDSHLFKLDQPLLDDQGQSVSNFTRLECYGSPFANAWIELVWQGSGWQVISRSLAAPANSDTPTKGRV